MIFRSGSIVLHDGFYTAKSISINGSRLSYFRSLGCCSFCLCEPQVSIRRQNSADHVLGILSGTIPEVVSAYIHSIFNLIISSRETH